VLEKDLGAALVYFMVYLVMLFVATNSKFYFFSGLFSGSAAAYIAYKLFDHVKVRVTAWKDPWSNIESSGYQIAQSLFAIGTGSWFGVGLCQGMADRIPVPESDFIFSAIAEEMGVLYSLCIILVCISCFIMFVMVAMRTKRTFYKMLAMGFGMCYVFQLFLNIGGVTKFIPSTGVTLPLVSYGGSSILSSIIIFNLIQGVYIIAAREEEAISEQQRKDQEVLL
jgi:cell division protein FtsW (lipid II flippase)